MYWVRRGGKWDRIMCDLPTGCRNDVMAIGRMSNGLHVTSTPLWKISNSSTSHSIPDLNGHVIRSRNDVPPIRRVSNGPHSLSVPLQRLPNGNTRHGVPNSN